MFVNVYKGVNIHLSIDQDLEDAKFEFMYRGFAYSYPSYSKAKEVINILVNTVKMILVFKRVGNIKVVDGQFVGISFRYISDNALHVVSNYEADFIPYSDSRLLRIKEMKEALDALYKRHTKEEEEMYEKWLKLIKCLKEESKTHDKV